MDTDAKGQLGGMHASEEVRKRLAGQSRGWKCGVCGKGNAEVMRERKEAVREAGGEGKRERDVVPEGMRLAYREDLGTGNQKAPSAEANGKDPGTPGAVLGNAQPAAAAASALPHAPVAIPEAARQAVQQPQQQVQVDEGVPPWIDKAIYGVIAALVFLLWMKVVG